MRINKEALKKHRFWVLLVVIVPLELLALIWLPTVVASMIEKKTEEINEANRQLLATQTRSMHELKLLEKKERDLNVRKNQIWQQVWDVQKDLLTWPGPLQSYLGDRPLADGKTVGLYFLDPLSNNRDRNNELCDLYHREYPKQIRDMVRLVDKVPFNESWTKVVSYVPEWRNQLPTYEEVWLAQEDVWAQRLLLGAIKDANAFVGQLKKVDGAAKPDKDKDELFRERFQNPYWQLDLILARDADGQHVFRGTIKNVGKRRQTLAPLDLRISLRANDPRPARLQIQGEPLAAGKVAPIKETRIDQANPEGLFGVEQVLDMRTAPVKRIDQIALGYHAHRTYAPKLQPPLVSRKGAEGQPGTGESDVGMATEGPALASPMMMGGFTGGSARDSDKTENGLERLRYIDVTPQVRRMPIGILVVVDQAHVQDVLTAFANSKLRFQLTQAHQQRFRGNLKATPVEGLPPEMDGSEQPMTDEAPATVAPTKPVRATVPARAGFPGRFPGMPMGPGALAAQEEPLSDLVELAIYGIASLYERFPPKPKAPEQPGAAAAGQPGAPGAPPTEPVPGATQ